MLLKSAMEFFDSPIEGLDKKEYLENSLVIEHAFNFIKKGQIAQLPSLEVNGKYFAEEVPGIEFIRKIFSGVNL